MERILKFPDDTAIIDKGQIDEFLGRRRSIYEARKKLLPQKFLRA